MTPKVPPLIVALAFHFSLVSCSDSVLAQIQPTLIWSDEFDISGPPDDKKWSYDTGGHGWGNQELQYYLKERSENARVENGVLIIEAQKEDYTDAFGKTTAYTSARLKSKDKGAWQYGRFEVRAKLPAGRGTWPAIWMLPANNVYSGWPNGGEIDIMEHVGFDMNRVHGTLHYAKRSGDNAQNKSVMIENVDTEFHIYTVDWLPDEMRFSVDGVVYHVYENPGTGWQDWPFDQPFHFLLNVAVGGHWGGNEGVDPEIWPQRMEVDYVRVFDLGDTLSLINEGDARKAPGEQILVNTDFIHGSNPWLMNSQVFSALGELTEQVSSWVGGPNITDYVSTSKEGGITFKHFDSPNLTTENSLFQYVRPMEVGLEPGDRPLWVISGHSPISVLF